MPRPIIIDTDPGQDDALAILLALGSPELDVVGITTVAGNVPLTSTSRNARIVCEVAGRRDVTVCAGADRPFLRPLVTAEHVHGATGLDGPVLPEPTMPLDPRHGVDFIVEAVMSSPPGSLTLCALGPLTNIAMAIGREPRLVGRVREIVLMGGAATEGGNVTPAAEFNIHVDPHAAALVFGAGIPIVMLPLDVTHKAVATLARVEAIRALGTPAAAAATGWLDFYGRREVPRHGEGGGPLHDPCVIAWLLAPGLFRAQACNVEIETASPLTLGMTVVDRWGVSGRPNNATVVHDVDADGFFELLRTAIGRL